MFKYIMMHPCRFFVFSFSFPAFELPSDVWRNFQFLSVLRWEGQIASLVTKTEKLARCMHWFAGTATTNNSQAGGSRQQKLISHPSGGWKSEICHQEAWFLPRSRSLTQRWVFSLGLHVVFPRTICAQISLAYEETQIRIRIRPHKRQRTYLQIQLHSEITGGSDSNE